MPREIWARNVSRDTYEFVRLPWYSHPPRLMVFKVGYSIISKRIREYWVGFQVIECQKSPVRFSTRIPALMVYILRDYKNGRLSVPEDMTMLRN